MCFLAENCRLTLSYSGLRAIYKALLLVPTGLILDQSLERLVLLISFVIQSTNWCFLSSLRGLVPASGIARAAVDPGARMFRVPIPSSFPTPLPCPLHIGRQAEFSFWMRFPVGSHRTMWTGTAELPCRISMISQSLAEAEGKVRCKSHTDSKARVIQRLEGQTCELQGE